MVLPVRLDVREDPHVQGVAAIEARLLDAAPGAAGRVLAMEAELAALGDGADDVELDLPISIYGGG